MLSELTLEVQLVRCKVNSKHDFSSGRKTFRAEVVSCEQLLARRDSISAATICW